MGKTNLNAHKLFNDAPEGNHLLAALNIKQRDESALQGARDEIRQAIRIGFSEWEARIAKNQLFEDAVVRKADALPTLKPKFRMQGSAVYHTINDPAHKPPQRIDYDDGVYLPVSFIAGTGNPMVSSNGYFELVETILVPLCLKRGWQLKTHKSHCVRVLISRHAHIDLPLYAIADEEYHQLVEAMVVKDAAMKVNARDGIEFLDHFYANMSGAKVRLAHRQRGWIVSDPRAIETWFKGAIDDHGKQVRRVSRYLKGWRDVQWPDYALSSITLMACVVKAFDALRGTLDDKRDDYALLQVARRLPEMLRGHIKNPVLDQNLDAEWTPEQRAAYVAGAEALYARLNNALQGTDSKAVALAEITATFGSRVPADTTLIDAGSTYAEVTSYPRERVAAPFVPKTTSG